MDEQLWKELEEVYLPARSESTRRLNESLRSLYGLDVRGELSRVRSRRIGVEDIIGGYEFLEGADSKKNAVLHTGYSNEKVRQKAKQIRVFSSSMDRILSRFSATCEERLESILEEMGRNRNNLKILRSLREKADKIDERIHGDIGKYYRHRRVRRPGLDKYHTSKEKIKSVDVKIRELVRKMQGIGDSANPKEDIDFVREKTKSGFFKSELVRECQSLRYYEGLILLSGLYRRSDKLLNDDIAYKRATYESKTVEEEKETEVRDEMFSILPSMVEAMNLPDGAPYSDIRKILMGNGPEGSWEERIETVLGILDEGFCDEDYRSKIYECARVALDEETGCEPDLRNTTGVRIVA